MRTGGYTGRDLIWFQGSGSSGLSRNSPGNTSRKPKEIQRWRQQNLLWEPSQENC